MHGSYIRLLLTVAISTLVMYWLMFLNVWSADHIYWSQTRAWMALIMGSVMAPIMLASMHHMYPHRSANLAVVLLSVAVFGLSLYMVRSQAAVGDAQWMQAMIPHHSIAILTSRRADIKDQRVRKLADDIIAAQEREIGEMQAILREMKGNR